MPLSAIQYFLVRGIEPNLLLLLALGLAQGVIGRGKIVSSTEPVSL